MVSGKRNFEIYMRFLGHFYNQVSNDDFLSHWTFADEGRYFGYIMVEKMAILPWFCFEFNECSMNDLNIQRTNLNPSMNLYEGFIVSVNFHLRLESDRDKVYEFLYVVTFLELVIDQTHISKSPAAKRIWFW